MRSPWKVIARTGVLVVAGFALLELVIRLLDGAGRGWPGGVLPGVLVALAGTVDGLHWYLPAGALAGGVAASASGGGSRAPRAVEVLGVAAGIAMLAFVLRGYLGPHLLHHALNGLLDPVRHAALARSLEPNDWDFFLRAADRAGGEEAGEAAARFLAAVHGTVAFALLAGLALPLGVAVGRGVRRFTGRARRLAAWGVATATIAIVYGAQIGAWRLALTGDVAPASVLYVGYLTAPVIIFLTLAWAGAVGPWAYPPSGRSERGPEAAPEDRPERRDRSLSPGRMP